VTSGMTESFPATFPSHHVESNRAIRSSRFAWRPRPISSDWKKSCAADAPSTGLRTESEPASRQLRPANAGWPGSASESHERHLRSRSSESHIECISSGRRIMAACSCLVLAGIFAAYCRRRRSSIFRCSSRFILDCAGAILRRDCCWGGDGLAQDSLSGPTCRSTLWHWKRSSGISRHRSEHGWTPSIRRRASPDDVFSWRIKD